MTIFASIKRISAILCLIMLLAFNNLSGIAQNETENEIPSHITQAPIPLQQGMVLMFEPFPRENRLWLLDTQTLERTLYLNLSELNSIVNSIWIDYPSQSVYVIVYPQILITPQNGIPYEDGTFLRIDVTTGMVYHLFDVFAPATLEDYPSESRILFINYPEDYDESNPFEGSCVFNLQTEECAAIASDTVRLLMSFGYIWFDNHGLILTQNRLIQFDIDTFEQDVILSWEWDFVDVATLIPGTHRLVIIGNLVSDNRSSQQNPNVFVLDLDSFEIADLGYDALISFVYSISVSPDGRYLEYGNGVRYYVVNLSTGEVILQFSSYSNYNINRLPIWLPDSENLAAITVSDDLAAYTLVKIDILTGETEAISSIDGDIEFIVLN
ncbi:MAG: hypothetical protein U0694_06120 [Anaerolineae bacterium]